ncbi:MAG TPA: hypothetical protein VL400_09170 [Polyangiaceae bacterium]|nr:hypothetical protein [Polyangiaceae bacterium]
MRPSIFRFAFFVLPVALGCNASLDDTCRDGTCTTSAVATTSGGPMGEECNGLPCDVMDVLQRNCQGCHTDPPKNNAPMPLLDYDDTQIYLYPPGDTGVKPVWRRMQRAIQTDADPPQMPQDNHPMASKDIATMNAWFETCDPDGIGGAAPQNMCESGPGDPNGGSAGGGGAGAGGAGGATTSSGGGGAGGAGGTGGI